MKNRGLAGKSILIVLVGLSLLAAASGWSAAVQDGPWSAAPRVLLAAIVFCTPMGVMFIKKREEKRARSGSSGGIEREVAVGASSAVFYDVIVLIAMLGACYSLFGNFVQPALVIFGLLAVIVVDFFLRWALIARSLS